MNALDVSHLNEETWLLHNECYRTSHVPVRGQGGGRSPLHPPIMLPPPLLPHSNPCSRFSLTFVHALCRPKVKDLWSTESVHKSFCRSGAWRLPLVAGPGFPALPARLVLSRCRHFPCVRLLRRTMAVLALTPTGLLYNGTCRISLGAAAALAKRFAQQADALAKLWRDQATESKTTEREEVFP